MLTREAKIKRQALHSTFASSGHGSRSVFFPAIGFFAHRESLINEVTAKEVEQVVNKMDLGLMAPRVV